MYLRLEPEIKFCLCLAKAVIDDEPEHIAWVKDYKNFNLSLLKELLSYHELWSYLISFANKDLIPDYLYPEFPISNIVVFTTLLEAEFWLLKEEFERKKIELIPIKGIDLILRGFHYRPMVDIDLLIKYKDLKRAEEVMRSLGYDLQLQGLRKDYWLKKGYHLQFHRFRANIRIHVELHWKLDITRGRQLFFDLWERSQIVQHNGKKVRLLSPEDSLIALTLHQRHYGKMFCLKYIIDLGYMIKNHSLDWDYLYSQIVNNRLGNLFYYFFSQLLLLSWDKNLEELVNRLKICSLYRFFIDRAIKFYLSTFIRDYRSPYLVSHFLFHESFWQAIKYLIFLPQEQFAKFFSLRPYTLSTFLFYSLRPIYCLSMLPKLFKIFFKK